MRDLSVRRAKRLRDIKVLIESLRENIKLLGLKDAERTWCSSAKRENYNHFTFSCFQLRYSS